ncbi:hypothetical protein CTZ27_30090 [Streptomyces griseocarneus]|nr:hypothetical protein CTZ27_30090 [Streptomyces griseocarneus]
MYRHADLTKVKGVVVVPDRAPLRAVEAGYFGDSYTAFDGADGAPLDADDAEWLADRLIEDGDHRIASGAAGALLLDTPTAQSSWLFFGWTVQAAPTICAAVPSKDPLPVTTLAPRSGIRIRTATLADGDTVVDLVSLVDLLRPAEEVSAALDLMRHALTDATDDGPLSHRHNHFLLAEDADGRAVGVIVCGPPHWIARPGRASGLVRRRLLDRLSTVHALAVRPEDRGRGIAQQLLRQAEDTFRDAGYAVLTLRHQRDLTRFYQRLGYTSSNRLSMLLPSVGLLTLADRPWKHAFKLLSPAVSVTTVQGMPTITGVLPD